MIWDGVKLLSINDLGWRTRVMTLDQVLQAIESFGPAVLADLFDALCGGCLEKVPVDALVRLGTNVARVIEAKNEKAAMQAAVAAVDAEFDAEQKAENELVPTGGGL